LNRTKRLDYIFGNHANTPVNNRFGWLEEALLGDIQTFIDGINDLVRGRRWPTPTKPRGGGNVSLPILVNTGLELVSALNAGTTKYRKRVRYDADENVALFVRTYFPGRSGKIPHIIWDATRNGLTHIFAPKAMRRRKEYIRFSFFVQDQRVPSNVAKSGRTLVVSFNSIEYYRVFRRAIAAYKRVLLRDRLTQIRFISAWKSIERHVKDLDRDPKKRPEADFVRMTLKSGKAVKLF
jgi:transposase